MNADVIKRRDRHDRLRQIKRGLKTHLRAWLYRLIDISIYGGRVSTEHDVHLRCTRLHLMRVDLKRFRKAGRVLSAL